MKKFMCIMIFLVSLASVHAAEAVSGRLQCKKLLYNSQIVKCQNITWGGVFDSDVLKICDQYNHRYPEALLNCLEYSVGQLFDKKALALCETIKYGKHLPICLKKIRGKNFDPKIFPICSRRDTTVGTFTCLAIAAGVNFPDTVSTCENRYDDEDVYRCLIKHGGNLLQYPFFE